MEDMWPNGLAITMLNTMFCDNSVLISSLHIWLAWNSMDVMVLTICIDGIDPSHIKVHINKQSHVYLNLVDTLKEEH